MSIPIISYYLTQATPVIAFTTKARIYPLMAPQMVISPYIVLHLISTTDGKKLDGADQYNVARVQVDCNSQTGTEAWNMGEAVRAALLDIIKDSVLTFKDIDVHFADVDMSDYDDARTMARRVQQFRVRWRNGP